MSAKKLPVAVTAQSIAQYVKQNAARAKAANKSRVHRGGGGESVREADHAGHHIVIRTTYHVEVDGIPVTGHLGVTNDGQVHYHAVPNVAYDSAIDLVKSLIDLFPDDFPATSSGSGPDQHSGTRERRGRAKQSGRRRARKAIARGNG